MKIDKLQSGSYRARKTLKGKTYSMTFDHKPTQREVYLAFEEKSKEAKEKVLSASFKEYAKQYTDLKRNVLSASTIREYDKMCDRLPKWFIDMPIVDIDQVTMQKLVNEMAATLSYKTIHDRHAFCVSVIRLFNPSTVFNTTFPQKVVKDVYMPSHEDIKKIMDYAKGGRYEIALRLACYGLRREEICALNVSDLKGNMLTINKALVQDTNKQWVIKTTKTVESTRTIYIDDELAKMIRSLDTEKVFEGYPETISNYLKRTQDKLKINHFSLHKIRHYFCMNLSEKGVSENDILAMGGWKQGNTSVMKNVYRYSNLKNEKEKMKNISEMIKNSTQ